MSDDSVNSEDIENELDSALNSGVGPKLARYALAFLGGFIQNPLLLGAASGTTSAWTEAEQDRVNNLFQSWLKLQRDEIREIGITIFEIISRLDSQDEKIRQRIESTEYLSLIKKAFRDWSAAESEEKRRLIRNLLINAAASRLCSDDVIRLFIKWIDDYSETHFKIIREVYKQIGITRAEIWNNIYKEEVREDSAEADLFKTMIFDLTTGHIIRQHREKDYYGNYVKSATKKHVKTGSKYSSAFDDKKPYELTGLGEWFVHYTMNEVVTKIEG